MAEANSTTSTPRARKGTTPTRQDAGNSAALEGRIAALLEENAVLNEAVERLDREKSEASGINPLVHSSPEDTIRAVQSVLGFVSTAMVAFMEQDASDYSITDCDIGGGIHQILNTCMAALGTHLPQEGGAS